MKWSHDYSDQKVHLSPVYFVSLCGDQLLTLCSLLKNLLIICAYVHDINKCKPTTKNKDHVQTLICYFF